MHRVLDLVGLKLDEARAIWREKQVRDKDVLLVETAPPVRPTSSSPRRENPNHKRRAKHPAKPTRPAPHFGAWRVLRVQRLEDEKLQVTVAREELKPELKPQLEPEMEPEPTIEL